MILNLFLLGLGLLLNIWQPAWLPTGVTQWAAAALGLYLITITADWLTSGSARLALHWGVSPIIIGVTIVASGTSAPEIFVSASGSLRGAGNITIGNVLGSNVANIALIIGAAALTLPIPVGKDTFRLEGPFFLGAAFALPLFAWDGHLARWEGIMLVLALIGFIYYYIWRARRVKTDQVGEETKAALEGDSALTTNFLLFGLGLVGLVFSSDLLVANAVEIARTLNISDYIISVSIIAVGTSLPELATSVVAARNGHSEIALGNVIGSNIWNILAALGLSAVASPFALEASVVSREIPVMLGFTLVFTFLLKFRPGIGRIWGGVLLFSYLLFLLANILL